MFTSNFKSQQEKVWKIKSNNVECAGASRADRTPGPSDHANKQDHFSSSTSLAATGFTEVPPVNERHDTYSLNEYLNIWLTKRIPTLQQLEHFRVHKKSRKQLLLYRFVGNKTAIHKFNKTTQKHEQTTIIQKKIRSRKSSWAYAVWWAYLRRRRPPRPAARAPPARHGAGANQPTSNYG